MKLDIDKYWRDRTEQLPAALQRKDFRFDPVFYSANYGDVGPSKLNPAVHYNTVGRLKGRSPNLYSLLKTVRPKLDARLKRLVIDPVLLDAMKDGRDEAFEVAFELIALGEVIDSKLSDFSERHYKTSYPDIAAAGIHPFRHFMEYGHREGRKTLQELRRNFQHGDQEYDPAKPTCLIGVHQLSRTGAPVVALQLAREAQATHNVVVAGLMSGELFEAFRRDCYRLVVTAKPEDELEYLADDIDLDFEFAILNSTESIQFVNYLVPRDVPFAMYLHEYTEYTQPYKPLFVSRFSDLLVFSSTPVRDSWANAFANVSLDVNSDTIIVPQRPVTLGNIGAKRKAESREALSSILGTDVTDKRIVYGAGHVHWRKGSDMFAMTAQLARKSSPDTIFVWIGDGENHEDPHFGVYYEKHLVEAGANLPGTNLFTLPAGDAYLPLARGADVMFLTSRFDPLPNVVFDALKFDNDVVYFRNASGFDDPIYADIEQMHPVEFGDLQAAVEAVTAVPPGNQRGRDPAEPSPIIIFDEISKALKSRLDERSEFVIGDGKYDVSCLYPFTPELAEARKRERAKVWSLRRRHVWKDERQVEAEIKASGNWVHQALEITPFALKGPKEDIPKFALHMHAYYTDNLLSDLQNYAAFRHAEKIVVTTDFNQKRVQIERAFDELEIEAHVEVLPNLGRDILPFLRVLRDDDGPADRVWGHIHQKRAEGTAMSGEAWHAFLMTILLGDEDQMSNAIDHAARADVGMVGAFDPLDVSWSGARRLLPRFADHFDQPLPEQPLLFPTGSMFWAKAALVKEMLEFFGDGYPWPTEPIATDGTIYHLIERLWPAMAARRGNKAVFIDKPDQRRS